MSTPVPVYLFVIWNRGLAEADGILTRIRNHFTVLRQFDVWWRAQDFLENLSAFYGWKSYGMWFGKRHRTGTGVFRAVVVRDDHPVFSDPARHGLAETLQNDNVYAWKVAFRRLTKHSNVVHASVNEAETRHNLRALTGESLEDFLARRDLDGSCTPLVFDAPIPYVPYPYAEENALGPRFLTVTFRLNRMEIFLLPRCGVPTVFSFSFRIFGIFSFAFCIGKVRLG